MVASFSESIEVSQERRIEQLKAECKNEKIEFISVQGIPLKDVNSAKASFGSALTSLAGGKAEYDFLQIYTLSQNNQMQYFFQPFCGLTPLPGQHFMVIPVSIKNPVQYRIKKKKSFTEAVYQDFMNRVPLISNRKIRICEWLCVDTDVQKRLKETKLSVLREISHVWQNGMTKIELEWTFQASAINDEFTLVSVQSGRYGSLGERTGLKQFREIVSFFVQFAGRYKGDGSNNVLISNSYLSSCFVNKFLNDIQEAKFTGIPDWRPVNIVKSIIANLIKFENHKKVYLRENIDAKKMKNLQAGILKKYDIDPSEVVAAASLDTFGGMKQAAVFTKDKLYISDLDYEITLNLHDVAGTKGLKGLLDTSLELELADGNTLTLKVGLVGGFMNDFFKELCKI